jgi:hypothetical protein
MNTRGMRRQMFALKAGGVVWAAESHLFACGCPTLVYVVVDEYK